MSTYRSEEPDAILDCPQGGDLACGVRFADSIGEHGKIDVRLDISDVLVDGLRDNYPFETITGAYALVVLARRLADAIGLTAADLAAGVVVRTPSGTPIELRNTSLEERAVWAACFLRSGRGLSLRRAHADLVASTIDGLAQRAAQRVRSAAA